jgi:hypothetical protein
VAWRLETLIAAALMWTVACASDGGSAADTDGEGDGAPSEPGGAPAGRECPPDSFLRYDNFGAPFFAEYCTGCHSSQLPDDMRQDAPPGVDFETLDGIRARADAIYLRAADANTTMPPVGGPSDETRALLGEWLACDTPE